MISGRRGADWSVSMGGGSGYKAGVWAPIQLEYRTPPPRRQWKRVWPLAVAFGVGLGCTGMAMLAAGVWVLGVYDSMLGRRAAFLIGGGVGAVLTVLCSLWFWLAVLTAALPVFDRRRTRTWRAAALAGVVVGLLAMGPVEVSEWAGWKGASDTTAVIAAAAAVFWGPIFSAMACTRRTEGAGGR